ncbi:TadE/TadG family type IV pilus assembly protein [Streptomyces sp. SM12]|uniref:TadE/TadG family type IV pilus assembly protein n=1 Tax=Streptomyces sp. SM12 TaxID=1071602 RepID=UPI000CD5102A|nr:TadE/TadG family type IV pilus assembly protein [Streptomyces sp. SM12]
MTRSWSADRGSFSLELAIVAPALFLLLGVLAAVFRVEMAAGTADSAARAAARAATLERAPATAQASAAEAAASVWADAGVTCSKLTVEVDTSGLTAPLGTQAVVRAVTACTAPLADLAVPGLPGSKTMTSEFTSVVDQYRERP